MTTPAPSCASPGRQAPEDFHPLELIAFFRRWPRSMARDLLYTFIWNCLFALVFWLLGGIFRPMTLQGLVGTLLFANVIGYTLHALFEVTGRLGVDRWARSKGMAATAAYYAGISLLGVFLGVAVVALWRDAGAWRWLTHPRWVASMAFSSILISLVLSVIFFSREREARAQAALERERARNERAEREAAAANLRALQAQIEPHFLFNTLANVASLVDADPAKAKEMLESFNRFLRSSLAATRTERTTLGAEAALIGAYLDVLQVRMGSRLRYRVEVPPALEAYELPPMLLQPVVENAIVHGLEPKVDGGEVTVVAHREGDAVEVAVADTGAGFAPTTRGGLGLTNLRERLRVLFGERGSLAIEENRPAGTRVVLRLPA